MATDTQELMKQVRRIRIITSRLVDQFISGAYHSVFKGQGIEFDEVREYVPGDDVRSIDWNVTARMGHPYVKRFCEERELTILFLADISGSQVFGSASRSKAELAAELTCLLALSAIKNQDKVGLVLFSDRIVKSIPAKKGRTAVMRLVREVLAAEETRHGTDIAAALQFLNRVQKRRAIVFLISDFMDSGYENELRIASHRHDVICCDISDPREFELVNAGLIPVEDPETGQIMLLDTGSRRVRERYNRHAAEQREQQREFFRKLNIDTLELSTERAPVDDIHRLFLKRQKRGGSAA